MLVANCVEVLVILLLRIIFVRSNNRRDKARAEGRVRYDEATVGLDDLTDFQNPAFRYVF